MMGGRTTYPQKEYTVEDIMLKKHQRQWVEALVQSVKAKKDYYIWNTRSLMHEINKHAKIRNAKLTSTRQVGKFLSYFQKTFRVFKADTPDGMKYILIKNHKPNTMYGGQPYDKI